MVCYQLASQSPATCLQPNSSGVSPIDMAVQNGSGEALNALLLACSGSTAREALQAIRELTAKGAVADTWAPNGQSALMLAAASNSAEGAKLLIDTGASLELQDALGRTALMWAAGCNAVDALTTLLDAGASVAHRDRRGRTALDYTAEFPEAKAVLEGRVKEMESKAAAAQEALLAELCAEEERKAASKANKKAKKKAAKGKKKASGAEPDSNCGSLEAERPVLTSDASEATTDELQAEPEVSVEHAEPSSSDVSGSVSPREAPDACDAAQAAAKPAATPQDPGGLGISPPNRPSSPEWCMVSKAGRHAAKSATGSHRRSPSSTSVASTCSVASQDTEVSRHSGHSGSERSVLRRGGGVSPPVMGRLPAQPTVRKPSLLSRSDSAADEVPQKDVGLHAGAHLVKAVPVAVAPAVVSAAPVTGQCSWVSVASGQHARGGHAEPMRPPSSVAVQSAPKEEVDSQAPAQEVRQPAVPAVPAVQAGESPAEPPKPVAEPPSHAAPYPDAAVQEIAALRADIQRLKLQQATAELGHQQEIAAILQDAARHETAAVAQAVADERMACVVRFAGFLQNNGAALAAAMPSLLSGAGLAGSPHQQQSPSMGLSQGMDIHSMMNNAQGSFPAEQESPEPSGLSTAMLASLAFPPPTRSKSIAPAPTPGVTAAKPAQKPNSFFDGEIIMMDSSAEMGMECHSCQWSSHHPVSCLPLKETCVSSMPPSYDAANSRCCFVPLLILRAFSSQALLCPPLLSHSKWGSSCVASSAATTPPLSTPRLTQRPSANRPRPPSMPARGKGSALLALPGAPPYGTMDCRDGWHGSLCMGRSHQKPNPMENA